MPDKHILRQLQALPLNVKVLKSQIRIREWYEHFNGDVYISFSGGKDSTVLAHLVHDLYPGVPLVFANTGLEYPEIQSFARKMGAEFVRPKLSFSEVISKYGYPIISKEVSKTIYCARLINHNEDVYKNQRQRAALMGTLMIDDGHRSSYNKGKWLSLSQGTQFLINDRCCYHIKKKPLLDYQSETKRFPYVATLAEESLLRTQAWLKHGCNAFDERKKTSQPLAFWTEQDILHYIHNEGLEIASVYGDIVAVDCDGMEYAPGLMCNNKLKCTGCNRTGCIFCGFGVHFDRSDETRLQRLARTHPKQYEYCMGGGQWVDNPKYDPFAPEKDGDWLNWNPKKIWVPSKQGLGMKKVFDDCNQIYGKGFIRYE